MTVTPEPDSRQRGTIRAPDFPGGLADRGIGFQTAGFTSVWIVSTTILTLFDGSGFWLYQWFDTATTGTYWATLVPLAALFDWMRKMFERGKAIREAKKAEILDKVRREAIEEEAERIKALLESPGVTLPPEIAAAIFGDASKNGS